jgi:hypothetical protein
MLGVAACGDDEGATTDEASADDCRVVLAALADIGVTPAAPEVGEEISDDYKDTLRGIVDHLESVDVQSGEVSAAVASLVGFADEVIAAATWSQEFETSAQASLTPLTEVCAAALEAAPTSS